MNDDELLRLSSQLKEYHELFLLSEIMLAIARRDVSKLVDLGANATQAAAQILRLVNAPVKCDIDNLSEVGAQSLAILSLNGVSVAVEQPLYELNKFANGYDLEDLMSSPDLFIRELSCLHGISKP